MHVPHLSAASLSLSLAVFLLFYVTLPFLCVEEKKDITASDKDPDIGERHPREKSRPTGWSPDGRNGFSWFSNYVHEKTAQTTIPYDHRGLFIKDAVFLL